MSVNGLEFGRNQHGTHGESVGNAFGHRDDVGTNAKPLVCKELATAAITTLDFVANQDGSVFLAGSSQSLGKFCCCHLDTTNTLNNFQNYSADIILSQFCLPCRKVIHGQISDVIVIVDRRYNLRIIGYFHSQRCTSVECFLGRKHAGATIGE